MDTRPQAPLERRGESSRSRSGSGAEDGAELDLLARLAGVGELLAEVVHEVRNGLVSIKTFVQLLPEHRDDAEFQERFGEITREEFERIERLLATVLEQASGGRAARSAEATDPSAAIQSVAALVRLRANKRGVRLHTEIGESAPLGIEADSLRQVLLNLILNAVEVSERGDEVAVECERRNALFEIRIQDRGPGIQPSERDRIFEPFFTTRSDSAGGLGLAISRRLIEDAGGTLTVRGRSGGGSTFRIRLPLPDDATSL